MTMDLQERNAWTSGLRSAISAMSQLSGGGPMIWMMYLQLHVDKKTDDDDHYLSHRSSQQKMLSFEF